MGLGPIAAIYQARFNRYLHNRGIVDTSRSRVWAFLGDGECDEPESLGALHVAAREGLDNLTFVVNCNLQRLDGPVRGNGKIVQELEAVFRGSGWNVIKVLWGREWDDAAYRGRVQDGGAPGRVAAPVVADDDGVAGAERTHHAGDVGAERVSVVSTRRLIAVAVAAQVWCDGPVAGRSDGFELVSHRPPKLRKAV